MRRARVSLWLSFIANSFLFVSSLLLLIDVGPRDWQPSYLSRKQAIETLRTQVNILGSLPSDVNVKGETRDLKLSSHPQTFEILRDFIRERSPLADTVRWSSAVGVGFSTISLPVGPLKLEAFRPLYVVELPEGGKDTFVLRPVGQFSDLESWLSTWRQSALTVTALLLLLAGFLLQTAEAALKLAGRLA
jgi:hypothetical protein